MLKISSLVSFLKNIPEIFLKDARQADIHRASLPI